MKYNFTKNAVFPCNDSILQQRMRMKYRPYIPPPGRPVYILTLQEWLATTTESSTPVDAQLTVAALITEGLALTNAALVCGLGKRRSQNLATIWSHMVRMQWIWEEAVGVCTRVPAFIWGNKENPRETSVRMVTIGTVTRLWDVCTLGVVTSTNDFSQVRAEVSNLFTTKGHIRYCGLVRVQHVTSQ